MNVDVEDISTVKKILHVKIPEEDVTRELDNAYGALKNKAKIKGFRPGKVPRPLLERRFKAEMNEEVSGKLIEGSYGEALREAGLMPLGQPSIDRPDIEKSQPYHYSITVEVCPPIENLNIKGLKLQEKVHTVTDEEVETQLKMLQRRGASLKTVDESRPVKNGDVVIIDYEGFKDGESFEPAGKTENFQVEVGSGRILKDFDQQLVGMETDSTKEFQVVFPEDYYNKGLAGLEVSFKVILKAIKEEILPEIDDEFAKYLGEYQTLDELKDAIRKDLERRYKAESERQLREDIIDMLIEQSDLEPPEVLVKEELSALVTNAHNAMTERGMSLEESGQTEEELSRTYYPIAEKKVREYLFLQKVVEQEEITLTDELLKQSYKDLAESINQPVSALKEFHDKDKDAYEMFRQKNIERLVIERIKENGNIEVVEV